MSIILGGSGSRWASFSRTNPTTDWCLQIYDELMVSDIVLLQASAWATSILNWSLWRGYGVEVMSHLFLLTLPGIVKPSHEEPLNRMELIMMNWYWQTILARLSAARPTKRSSPWQNPNFQTWWVNNCNFDWRGIDKEIVVGSTSSTYVLILRKCTDRLSRLIS